jgi:hypothetical protein
VSDSAYCIECWEPTSSPISTPPTMPRLGGLEIYHTVEYEKVEFYAGCALGGRLTHRSDLDGALRHFIAHVPVRMLFR